MVSVAAFDTKGHHMIYRTPFTFFRGNLGLAGQLFRNTDRLDVRQPAIIVTGSWLTVKEQMPELLCDAPR